MHVENMKEVLRVRVEGLGWRVEGRGSRAKSLLVRTWMAWCLRTYLKVAVEVTDHRAPNIVVDDRLGRVVVYDWKARGGGGGEVRAER